MPTDLGRLARLARHTPARQLAHRVRLRAQRQWYGLRPGVTARRYELARPPVLVGGWPVGFRPLDAQVGVGGCPSLSANLQGVFHLLNVEHHLGEPIDWSPAIPSQLWRFHLHYFDWAWVLLDDPSEDCIEAVWHLLTSWQEANPVGRGDAWSPYVTSLRAWTLCALTSVLATDEQRQAKLAGLLWSHARYVRANLEKDVGGNHLLKNLKALLGLGVLLGDERLLTVTGRELDRQLQVQVLPDGGHFERSPGYHAQVLGDLIDLAGLLTAADALRGLTAHLEQAVSGMQGWLSAMRQPDGTLPALNDSIPVSAARLSALGVADPAATQRLTVLEPSGYVIARPWPGAQLILDVGPPSPDELPAHAHADALAIVLSVDGRPLLLDSGTSVYGAGPRRQYERSTRAHNTLEIDGENSTEVFGAFRAGRRHRARLLAATDTGGQIDVAASHDGYRFLRGGPEHRRTVHINERQIDIVDEVTGSARHDLRLYWHLAAGARPLSARGGAQHGVWRLEVSGPPGLEVRWISSGQEELGVVGLAHNVTAGAPCLIAALDQATLPVTLRTRLTRSPEPPTAETR